MGDGGVEEWVGGKGTTPRMRTSMLDMDGHVCLDCSRRFREVDADGMRFTACRSLAQANDGAATPALLHQHVCRPV